MNTQALTIEFYKYAHSVTEQFIMGCWCYSQLCGSSRKLRKLFLSNCSLYLIARDRVRQHIHFKNITHLVLSSHSAQLLIRVIPSLKHLIIDSLECRQTIITKIVQYNSAIDVKQINEPQLSMQESSSNDNTSTVLNILRLRSEYENIRISKGVRIMLQQLMQDNMMYKLYSGRDVSGRMYTIKMYDKDRMDVDQVMRERRNLQEILSPYVPVLVYAYVTAHHLYIITQHYRGLPVKSFMQKYTLQHHSNMFAQLITAVGHLHEAHLHYNITLESVFVSESGHILLPRLSLCTEYSSSKGSTSSHTGCNGWTLLPDFMYMVKEQRPLTIPIPKIKDKMFGSLLHSLIENQLGSKNDYHEILKHPYFEGIDKEQLMLKKIIGFRKFETYFPKIKDCWVEDCIQDDVLYRGFYYSRDGSNE